MADNKDKKVLNAPDKRMQNDACISSAEREGQVTKAQPKGNVPALRFPEFSGEWESVLLEDVAEFQKKRISSDLLNNSNYISTENILQNFGGVQNSISIPTNTNVIEYQRGDVLLSNIRPYLKKVWLSDRHGGCSADVFVLRGNQCERRFLYYVIASDRFINFVMSGAKGVKMPRGDKSQMEKFAFFIPTNVEQQKIAMFLSMLDERIRLQNKIIEDLKKLKSAIVEALFCAPKESMPAKRLSPYSKEWKLIKLSDICQRVQTKNTGSKCRQVLTITAQYGLVNQEDFFNKTVASENLEGYYLLRKGDFAYNKSYSGDYAWGAVKRLDRYEQGVLSPLYICFRPDTAKVDADYLAHYFESKKWHKGIADIAGEGARNHGLLNISVIDFFNTIHRIPDLDEQKDIAQVLNLLSFKLSCGQHVMQSLTMQRSYLLQKMFI